MPARGLVLVAVDNESPLIRRMCDHVEREHPPAIEVGVDMWKDTDRRYVDCYLIARDRRTLAAYVAALTKLDPSLAMPSDRELGYEALPDGTWRTHLLERTAAIEGRIVKQAHKDWDAATGRIQVAIDLTPDAADQLAKLTTQLHGRKLAFVVDGEIVSAAVIEQPITTGKTTISMGGSDPKQQDAQADRLVAALQRS